MFRTDGLFQGYVLQSDATPAVGYTVQLRGVAGVTARQSRAKTDTDGYFRIELGVGDEAAPRTNSMHDIFESLSLEREAAPAQPAASEKAAASGRAAAKTDVEVLDPSGVAVLRDESPPDFTGNVSAFRYYLLPGPSPAAKSNRAA